MTRAEHLRGRRVGVALSSAFFGFFGHTGFVRALLTAGVRPVLYGGASAGAMVAAAAAAGQLDRFGDVALGLKRRDFWDPGVPFGAPPGLLRGRRFPPCVLFIFGSCAGVPRRPAAPCFPHGRALVVYCEVRGFQ